MASIKIELTPVQRLRFADDNEGIFGEKLEEARRQEAPVKSTRAAYRSKRVHTEESVTTAYEL